jgi:hypothetical protein
MVAGFRGAGKAPLPALIGLHKIQRTGQMSGPLFDAHLLLQLHFHCDITSTATSIPLQLHFHCNFNSTATSIPLLQHSNYQLRPGLLPQLQKAGVLHTCYCVLPATTLSADYSVAELHDLLQRLDTTYITNRYIQDNLASPPPVIQQESYLPAPHARYLFDSLEKNRLYSATGCACFDVECKFSRHRSVVKPGYCF